MSKDIQYCYLCGAKSIGAYGGYETFINKLTEYHQNLDKIKYFIACKENGDGCMDETKLEGAVKISDSEFEYHNAHCFKIRVPHIGPGQAIYYDIKALSQCCKHIKENQIPHPIVYIMACRIGPFARYFYKKIHKLGGQVFLNPDGHEWMRAKWSKPVRRYWKISEQQMVKYSDLVICDSINIETYIHKTYDAKGIRGRSPKTTFIAYGAETRQSQLSETDPKLTDWFQSKGLKPKEYYLAVGRFVPENNYETMIREFMMSRSKKDLAIITTANEAFLQQLEKKLDFKRDSRIKFVGTVYDQELLMKIREDAYGYFHGHEVGGTNPSLLEALGSTDLNLLLNVGFNREVANDAALYWNKEEGNLAALIDRADAFNSETIHSYGEKAKSRIREAYSWEFICKQYAEVFLNNKELSHLKKSDVKQLFKKQGGLKLLKQYWQGGAFFTAAVEFLLLGKSRTALEILRLSATLKTKQKLERKYRKKLAEFDKNYEETLPHESSNKVWICWFQKIENAPLLVQKCYQSVLANMPDREVTLITEENMADYVQFPDFILEKWKCGQITHTHMTDLLRLELLIRYGGMWLDATVFCSGAPISDYFFHSDLFFYQSLKPGKDGQSSYISSWLISAKTNNKLLMATKELCYEYWKHNTSMWDYFLFHDFMSIVLDKYEEDWKRIIPRDNSAPHILLLRLFDPYDRKMWESIKEQTPFHKLTYKFADNQTRLKGTYYDILLNQDGNEI